MIVPWDGAGRPLSPTSILEYMHTALHTILLLCIEIIVVPLLPLVFIVMILFDDKADLTYRHHSSYGCGRQSRSPSTDILIVREILTRRRKRASRISSFLMDRSLIVCPVVFVPSGSTSEFRTKNKRSTSRATDGSKASIINDT